MGSATTHRKGWAYPLGNSMASQKDLHTLADDDREMVGTYYQAMKAIIEYRDRVTAIQTAAELKNAQLEATEQLMQFATSVVFE